MTQAVIVPSFIQNTSRIPKLGKNFDVTEGSIDLVKGYMPRITEMVVTLPV
jgi:hypothetical protein